MSEPGDLGAFLAGAWQHLMRGVADRRAPARTPVLASVSPGGMPEARMVVLRAAAQGAGTLEVHSDTETGKVAALQARPHAALHVWVPKARLQIRMDAQVEIRTGPQVSRAWQQVPPAARVSYGAEPAPGTPIADVADYAQNPDPARFAVLHCVLTRMDLLHLDTAHRRAVYARADGWQGTWVAP